MNALYWWLLLAFLLYNDGIQTIIRMAAIYGSEVGIDQGALQLVARLEQLDPAGVGRWLERGVREGAHEGGGLLVAVRRAARDVADRDEGRRAGGRAGGGREEEGEREPESGSESGATRPRHRQVTRRDDAPESGLACRY